MAHRGAQAHESRCTGCHSVDQDRVGPRHASVRGRKARLERWLADPQALVPGQRMG